MKTSGFNFQDLKEDNIKMGSMLDIEGELNMKEERPKKKKTKYNFDHLFPKPKGQGSDMGMSDFVDGKAFDGIL